MRDVIQSELSVGGRDQLILELNKEAFDEIKVEKQLIIVPEVAHLFKEPGALTQVERLTTDWFKLHLEPSILVTAITG
jgi:putative phosphoribosyl transferase